MPSVKWLLYAVGLTLASVCLGSWGWPLANRVGAITPPPGINKAAVTVATRFSPPPGFRRLSKAPGSFAEYLANVRLKPWGSKVYYFDGVENTEADLYASVLDYDVGRRDLQQCADAVMRLRAEYLYSQQRYDAIHFNFTSGFRADYVKWAAGYRIRVRGNQVEWSGKPRATPDYSYKVFREYLTQVFTYAGTLSLSKELVPVASSDQVLPGDVFIRGGSPGHAVLVLDVAENPQTRQRTFLICQSYMPAQSIHVLVNREQPPLSPWYNLATTDRLYTPQWTFEKDELRRFRD